MPLLSVSNAERNAKSASLDEQRNNWNAESPLLLGQQRQ